MTGMNSLDGVRFEHISRTPGRSGFDADHFESVGLEYGQDRILLGRTRKPHGGLWSSPVFEAENTDDNGTSEWHDYMAAEMWEQKVHGGFRFNVDPQANVLEIRSSQDVTKYADIMASTRSEQVFVDWEEVAKRHDAFYLDRSMVRPYFADWCIGSLVVCNPEIMQGIEEIPPYTFPDPPLL